MTWFLCWARGFVLRVDLSRELEGCNPSRDDQKLSRGKPRATEGVNLVWRGRFWDAIQPTLVVGRRFILRAHRELKYLAPDGTTQNIVGRLLVFLEDNHALRFLAGRERLLG